MKIAARPSRWFMALAAFSLAAGVSGCSKHEDAEAATAPQEASSAAKQEQPTVTLTGEELGKQALASAGRLAEVYAGKKLVVTGMVESVTPYMYTSGGDAKMGRAVVMVGVAEPDHGAGHLIQLNPAADDTSLVEHVTEGQRFTAECTQMTEIMPGSPLLKGCTFHQ